LLVVHNIGNVLVFTCATIAVWMLLLLYINEQWRTTLGRLSLSLFAGLAGLLTLLAIHETITGVIVSHLSGDTVLWYEISRLVVYSGLLVTMLLRVVFGLKNTGHKITWMPYDDGE
jgi:hypothetical protein